MKIELGTTSCELKSNSAIDNCPFDRSVTKQHGVDDFESRHPIKLWKKAYDSLSGCGENPKIIGKDNKPNPDYFKELKEYKACSSNKKKRLSKDKQLQWENQFRFDIVGQNYQHDKTYY